MSDDKTIDDGGPAFMGMSMRAWFAGQALAGLATDKSVPCEQAADLAVRYADDLIARLKR